MARPLINSSVTLNVIGSLILIMGVLMLPSIGFSIYYGEDDFYPFITSAGIALLVGFILKILTRQSKNAEIKKRDGYLIVTAGWVSMAIFGTLPYLLSGSIPTISGAFFETMSGLSTTGALTIAILPLLGIGGMELFVAEAPGPTKDKIHPRIKETAKRLWVIYVFLTVLETIILLFCGMNFFDAINHALTTNSTGGFSTKQDSIAAFNSPLIEAVIIFFMFVAGTNFTLLYFGFKGKFSKFWKNDEFKWYLGAVILLIALLTPVVHANTDGTFLRAFRETSFQVVSTITTTGYASADFTTWGSLATFIFFLLLFSGASAGSTSGGIKIVRIVVLMKNGFLEFKKRLHPNAVIPVYLNKQKVPSHIIYNLLAFIFLYLFVFVLGSVVMTGLGENFEVAISSVATSLGNVGPGISDIGPSHTFSAISPAGKWLLSFLMLFGRLELFTVALLFTPYYWRRN